MTLIDPRNTALSAAYVVQDRFRYLETDTEPLKPRCDGSADIVQHPMFARVTIQRLV